MQADNDPIAPSRGIPRDDIKVCAIVHPFFSPNNDLDDMLHKVCILILFHSNP